MSQAERDLVKSIDEVIENFQLRPGLGSDPIPVLKCMRTVLMVRLDAEVGEGESEEFKAFMADVAAGDAGDDIYDIKHLEIAGRIIRQLLEERDEARAAFGVLVKIEAGGLKRINGLEARVKELGGNEA